MLSVIIMVTFSYKNNQRNIEFFSISRISVLFSLASSSQSSSFNHWLLLKLLMVTCVINQFTNFQSTIGCVYRYVVKFWYSCNSADKLKNGWIREKFISLLFTTSWLSDLYCQVCQQLTNKRLRIHKSFPKDLIL